MKSILIKHFSLISVLTIMLGLVVDQHLQPWGQSFVTIWVWFLFSTLIYYSNKLDRIRYLICLLLAWGGEVILSDVWGLYHYREAFIPFFVPPGHVLLYRLGLVSAEKLNWRQEYWAPILFLPLVAYLYYTGQDHISAVLFLIFLPMVLFGKFKRLYASMYVLALIMELWGTWLGNWEWVHARSFNWPPIESWGPMMQLNPPVSAGVFYCLLDFLVVHLSRSKIFSKQNA